MFEEKKILLKDKLEINDNKNFGYKVKSEVTEGKGKNKVSYCILERDKNNSNYLTYVRLEKEYYKYKNEIKEYKGVNEILLMILFLLLIIPGVVYLFKKKNEKKKIEENNAKMKKEMARIIQEAEQFRR